MRSGFLFYGFRVLRQTGRFMFWRFIEQYKIGRVYVWLLYENGFYGFFSTLLQERLLFLKRHFPRAERRFCSEFYGIFCLACFEIFKSIGFL